MERYGIHVPGFRRPLSIAMGPIFGGHCIVGPPEALSLHLRCCCADACQGGLAAPRTIRYLSLSL